MIRILKKSHRPIREKWIAIFVCAVFFTTSVFLPQSNAAMSKIPIAAHRSLTDDLTAIALPEGIGKIQETYRGTSDEIVVLIQDAHSIPDAQRSIRSVIDHFQTTYGVSLVGVEGASEKLDSQIFRSFPDQELLRKTLESYAERGELTGGTASALFNAFPAAYYGVEDGPLYEKGISYYFKAIELEPEIMARVGSMVSALNHEKEAVYSKELLEIDRLLIDFGNNKADLLRVLSKLGRYQPPSKGSELAVLLEEIQSNSRSETGTSEIQNEVKKIAEQVVSVLKRQPPSPKTRQELGEYYAKFQGFQTSGMTSQAFALYLKDAAKKHKMNIRVSPELDGLVDHQKKLKDIEGTRLFAEFKRYADAVTEKLIGESLPGTQGLIRQLDAETKGLELVRRLARLELTFGDWEKIRKLKLRSDRWAAFQDDVVLRDEVSPLLGKMEPHLDFYRVAEQRDQVFLKNIQSVMRKQNKTSALLVAGGFHTEGLTQTFKAKGISYVLVTPKIGSVPKESFYREHMQGQVSWSNYFEIKDGKVNLYDAFVRATRDKLIRSQGEKNAVLRTLDPVLKNWRDQILRDLSADGRITQASEYTRFLDELSRSPRSQASSLKKKWLANIDHFGEGLRKLQGEGHLSEFSILQLIKTITAAELATSNALAVNARVDRRLLPSIQRPELRRESKKTRSEMRTEMKSAIQNLQGIQIAALENGDLLPVIEAAVRKGFGGIEVPRSHIGGSGRLKDYIDLMERGETVIKDPPAPFETDFGSIDLSKLNDVTRYEGYDASAQLARDIHIAHLLGFITIDPFNGVSPRTLTYQLLKRKKIKISNESSPWPIWIVLKNRFQKMIETGDAKKYQGQEGHVRFFKEVFKNKAVELHAGNLFTAISDIVPKELGWQKINCNLGEVLALRQDFIEKLAEPGWVSAHRGDGQQIEYYVQLFGKKAKKMHAGNLFSAISDLIPEELGWQVMNLNLGDVIFLREDLARKLAEPGWIAAHQGDWKQIEYYLEVFQREAENMHAGNLCSAISSLIPQELGWQRININLGDAITLREDLEKKLQDERWIAAHRGDGRQIEYYLEVFGEKAKTLHAGTLFSAISSLIPQQLEWQMMNLNLGDAIVLRGDLIKRLSAPEWTLAHQGNGKQIEYYSEVFGKKAKDMHAGNLFSVISGMIPQKLHWQAMHLNVENAIFLRNDFMKKVAEPGWITARQGDGQQIEYYVEVFGKKAKDMRASSIISAISDLIPRQLGWQVMNINLGEAIVLREDFIKKLLQPGWIAAYQGDEKQIEYYFEVFGKKASAMHAGSLISAISSLIPQELKWHVIGINLRDSIVLREDFVKKLLQPGWIAVHHGDDKQAGYYLEIFGEKAKDMNGGGLFSAISGLIPRELRWQIMHLNLRDVIFLRTDFKKNLQDEKWRSAHQGEEGQIRYYAEVFGAQKVWSNSARNLFSVISSLMDDSPVEKEFLDWHYINEPMSIAMERVGLGSAAARAEMRTEMNDVIQNLQGIRIAALENGELLPAIELAIRKGFGGIAVPRPTTGNRGRVRDYIDLMEHGETIIKDPPAPFETDFGLIDLSRLNDVTRYGGYDASAQLARDIHMAHLLGLITIDEFRAVSPTNLPYKLLKKKGLELSPITVSWSDSIVLRNRFQQKVRTGEIKNYSGDEGQIRFYREVLGDHAKDRHAGNLVTAIANLIPKELSWKRLLLNLGDVITLREDLEKKLQDTKWIEEHRGNAEQITYYLEMFGKEKAMDMHAGGLFSAISSLIPKGLNWQRMQLNLGNVMILREDLEKRLQDAEWIESREGDAGQIQYYLEMFGKEARGMPAGGLFSAITRLIPEELNWHYLNLNLGEAIDLREDLGKKLHDTKWMEAHRGSAGQITYYREVLGERSGSMHGRDLFSAISSLISEELDWQVLDLNLGDAIALREDFKRKLQDAKWAQDNQGDAGQIRYYLGFFGGSARDMFAGSPHSVISSLIPKGLNWQRMQLSLGNVMILREDLEKRLQDAQWIESHQGDAGQIRYYIEVFGKEKAMGMNAGSLSSAISSLIPKGLNWQRLPLNLGDVMILREGLEGRLQDAEWIENHQDDAGQIKYYLEMFGEEARGMSAVGLFSVISSLIPQELHWQMMKLNLGDAIVLREDLEKKLQDAKWIEGHQGDGEQIKYYLEVFRHKKAGDMQGGAFFSAISSLIPKELHWQTIDLNLRDAVFLRTDFEKNLQDEKWLLAHQGEEGQIRYYVEALGVEKVGSMRAKNIFSTISSLMDDLPSRKEALGWHYVDEPMSIAMERLGIGSAAARAEMRVGLRADAAQAMVDVQNAELMKYLKDFETRKIYENYGMKKPAYPVFRLGPIEASSGDFEATGTFETGITVTLDPSRIETPEKLEEAFWTAIGDWYWTLIKDIYDRVMLKDEQPPAPGSPESALRYTYWMDHVQQMDFYRHLLFGANQISAEASVLDIGTGAGWVALGARKHQEDLAPGSSELGRIVGVDLSAEAVAIAERLKNDERLGMPRDGHVSFQQANLTRLPFPDASFDVVASDATMSHLPLFYRRAALREIRRVMKPGGKLLLADYAVQKSKLAWSQEAWKAELSLAGFPDNASVIQGWKKLMETMLDRALTEQGENDAVSDFVFANPGIFSEGASGHQKTFVTVSLSSATRSESRSLVSRAETSPYSNRGGRWLGENKQVQYVEIYDVLMKQAIPQEMARQLANIYVRMSDLSLERAVRWGVFSEQEIRSSGTAVIAKRLLNWYQAYKDKKFTDAQIKQLSKRLIPLRVAEAMMSQYQVSKSLFSQIVNGQPDVEEFLRQADLIVKAFPQESGLSQTLQWEIIVRQGLEKSDATDGLPKAAWWVKKAKDAVALFPKESGLNPTRKWQIVRTQGLEASPGTEGLPKAEWWVKKAKDVVALFPEESGLNPSLKWLIVHAQGLEKSEATDGLPKAEWWVKKATEVVALFPKESGLNPTVRWQIVYAQGLEKSEETGGLPKAEWWVRKAIEVVAVFPKGSGFSPSLKWETVVRQGLEKSPETDGLPKAEWWVKKAKAGVEVLMGAGSSSAEAWTKVVGRGVADGTILPRAEMRTGSELKPDIYEGAALTRWEQNFIKVVGIAWMYQSAAGGPEFAFGAIIAASAVMGLRVLQNWIRIRREAKREAAVQMHPDFTKPGSDSEGRSEMRLVGRGAPGDASQGQIMGRLNERLKRSDPLQRDEAVEMLRAFLEPDAARANTSDLAVLNFGTEGRLLMGVQPRTVLDQAGQKQRQMHGDILTGSPYAARGNIISAVEWVRLELFYDSSGNLRSIEMFPHIMLTDERLIEFRGLKAMPAVATLPLFRNNDAIMIARLFKDVLPPQGFNSVQFKLIEDQGSQWIPLGALAARPLIEETITPIVLSSGEIVRSEARKQQHFTDEELKKIPRKSLELFTVVDARWAFIFAQENMESEAGESAEVRRSLAKARELIAMGRDALQGAFNASKAQNAAKYLKTFLEDNDYDIRRLTGYDDPDLLSLYNKLTALANPEERNYDVLIDQYLSVRKPADFINDLKEAARQRHLNVDHLVRRFVGGYQDWPRFRPKLSMMTGWNQHVLEPDVRFSLREYFPRLQHFRSFMEDIFFCSDPEVSRIFLEDRVLLNQILEIVLHGTEDEGRVFRYVRELGFQATVFENVNQEETFEGFAYLPKMQHLALNIIHVGMPLTMLAKKITTSQGESDVVLMIDDGRGFKESIGRSVEKYFTTFPGRALHPSQEGTGAGLFIESVINHPDYDGILILETSGQREVFGKNSSQVAAIKDQLKLPPIPRGTRYLSITGKGIDEAPKEFLSYFFDEKARLAIAHMKVEEGVALKEGEGPMSKKTAPLRPEMRRFSQTIIAALVDALKPGEGGSLNDTAAREIEAYVAWGRLAELIEVLKLAVREEMALAEEFAEQSGTSVKVTREMAEMFVKRIIDALEASGIKGNLAIAFDVSPDRNFMEALRSLKSRIGTAVFIKDKARALDREALEGLTVQRVGSLANYNPRAAENPKAVPVLTGDIESAYFDNGALFGVGLESGNIQGEPFLEVAENVMRIAVGLFKADLVTRGAELSPGEINAKLLEMLFKLDVGPHSGVLSMKGRHLVVHREALQKIMLEYWARSEVRKSA